MIVISPAKRLDSIPSNADLKTTQPIFDTQAKFLAEQLSKLQADDLSNLMGISSNIAELNAERFKNWDSISIPEKRAIFQFQGDVFKHLNARDFSQDDENYMKHTLSWHNEKEVKINYRNVNLSTLTSDVQTFPPKERVY